jgi:hypothetical protein
MKYFTREWASGMLSERKWESVYPRYRRHIANILPLLPDNIARLETEIIIHDGLIRGVAVNRKPGTLSLELRCGDLQVGYYDLNLHYSGVAFSKLDLSTLATVARDPDTECLYDELDIENKQYVHRILFYPAGEIEIIFMNLNSEKVSRPDRSYKRMPDPYIETFKE